MSYKNILVAYDGSDHAKQALEAALEMVDCTLAEKIVVLYVTEAYRGADPMLESAASMSGVPIITFTQVEHDELDEGIAAATKGYEDVVETIVKIGIPKEEILNTIQEKSCSLVIMGSRGLGAIRGMLGSVSFGVIRDSEVPVLVIK